ncbi:MAG: DUF2061 domain-containing protein [Alphaproteobacteria bacterium]|nr:DUF2061 domain-containing protein [Alphaproteobacteria bacterium]
MMRLIAVALLGIVGAWAGTAAAADLAGSTLTVGRKSVPLPLAAWTIVAEGAQDVPLPGTGRHAVLDGAVAVAGDAPEVRYLALVRANRAPTPGGFGVAEACRRTDLHSARMASGGGSAVAACTFVTHVVQAVPADADPAWAAAIAVLGRAGRRLPATWLVAGVRIVDGDDLLDVRYYFNPTAIGFPDDLPGSSTPAAAPGWLGRAATRFARLLGREPAGEDGRRWPASAWAPAATASDERRGRVVGGLEAWVATTQPTVYTGFKGWPVDGVAPPDAWIGDLQGVVSLEGGLPVETALWKTLSWRAVGSSLDAVVSYVFTGSIGAAGGITIVGGLVNATVYYLHEKAWEILGTRRSPGDVVTELRPAGIER